MLASNGRHSRRSHHGRRAKMSTAVLRDDVTSGHRDGVELVGVVEVARGEWRRCRVRGGGRRLPARRVVEPRVRPGTKRRLAAGRMSIKRTVAEACRLLLLLLQLPLVTVQGRGVKAVRRCVAGCGARRNVELEPGAVNVVDLMNSW